MRTFRYPINLCIYPSEKYPLVNISLIKLLFGVLKGCLFLIGSLFYFPSIMKFFSGQFYLQQNQFTCKTLLHRHNDRLVDIVKLQILTKRKLQMIGDQV